jgi:Hemerythrin HHE cation binding domain
MSMAEARSPNPRGSPLGEALVKELKWVHDMIRRDLAAVRRMAADVAAGLAAADVRVQLASLATNGPLWQLKINCLQYCHFVHSHHHAESLLLFPELRRSTPALDAVVDKLEADHTRVSDLLDEVEAAARALGGQGDASTRQRLVEALQRLAADLLAHLQYEEEQISGTLRTWTRWPHQRG